MPKLYNTVTKKYMFVPSSYVGKFPFEEHAPEAEPVTAPEPVEPVKSKKKSKYIADAVDADGDGIVQDGTEFERPVGTELSPEELTAIQESDSAL